MNMSRKILIVSLFATLMLFVPMTSVVGVSDVENDCGCQVVNSSDLFRFKLLLVRIKVVTNILLLRFGYIPEAAEKCNEILGVINSNRQLDYPIICDILEPIWNLIEDIIGILYYLGHAFKDNPIIFNIINILGSHVLRMYEIFLAIGVSFQCEWVHP
jgi:hypothetical protein